MPPPPNGAIASACWRPRRGALYAASFAGWRFAYGLMAALMLVGMATVWLTPEPGGVRPPEALPGDTALGRVAAWLERAVLAPFRDMLTPARRVD